MKKRRKKKKSRKKKQKKLELCVADDVYCSVTNCRTDMLHLELIKCIANHFMLSAKSLIAVFAACLKLQNAFFLIDYSALSFRCFMSQYFGAAKIKSDLIARFRNIFI